MSIIKGGSSDDILIVKKYWDKVGTLIHTTQ